MVERVGMRPYNAVVTAVKLTPSASSLDEFSVPAVASRMQEPCQLVLLFSVCRSLIGAYGASEPRT